MIRLIVSLLIAFISCFFAKGQYNNIFIIDCSRSMICPNAEKNNDWKTEEPAIRWNPAKKALKEWISSYEDNDIITILPFNDNVVGNISAKKKDLDFSKIERDLDAAVQSHHGKTSICNAWKIAEKYFDKNKYNFFYIITDGVDDHAGPCKLVEQIRSFCDKIPAGSHGYILKLDQASFPKEILEALNNSPCLSQLPAGPIPIFGGFLSDEVTVVTSNMKTGGIDRTSPLKFDRKSKYAISSASNDPYFDIEVTNGIVNNGVLTFDVKLKDGIDINQIKQQLNSDTYEIPVILSSKEVKYLRNNKISIIVTLKAISELQLFSDISQIELGRATWYDKFIIDGSQPEVLSYVLQPKFNKEALLNNSEVTLKVDKLPNNVKLLVNGEANHGTFKVNSNLPIDLKFITVSPCENFDIDASLSVIKKKNLDRISGDEKISIGGEVREKMNPLKCILIWVGIIFGIGLILWVLFNLVRPCMVGKLNIIDSDGTTIKGLGDITGFHKVYLYNGPDKCKSGILDMLLFTKKKFIHIDGMQKKITITGNSNKTIYIHPITDLSINGNSVVSKITLKAKVIFTIGWSKNANIIRIKYF